MAAKALPDNDGALAPEIASEIAERLADLDRAALSRQFDADGHAFVPGVLSTGACRAIAALYDRDALFRSRVVMARHNFGEGEYRYFDYPLPAPVAMLRALLYPPLAAVANEWRGRYSGRGEAVPPWPDPRAAYLERCHRAGQTRPTPLLLRYGPGDYNRLHQDVYGEHVFPVQATILLSAPGRDFTGGEFVLTEQRPRTQSRAEVIPLAQGDAVLFPVRHRPALSANGGFHRVQCRHGVSRLRSGRRYALGIIFHDAA